MWPKPVLKKMVLNPKSNSTVSPQFKPPSLHSFNLPPSSFNLPSSSSNPLPSILKGLDTLSLADFSPLFTRETTFFNFVCFPAQQALLKRVYSKIKEFAISRRANSFLLEKTAFQKGGSNSFESYFRLFFLLCWGLMAHQPLWVIVCHLPNKGYFRLCKCIHSP